MWLRRSAPRDTATRSPCPQRPAHTTATEPAAAMAALTTLLQSRCAATDVCLAAESICIASNALECRACCEPLCTLLFSQPFCFMALGKPLCNCDMVCMTGHALQVDNGKQAPMEHDLGQAKARSASSGHNDVIPPAGNGHGSQWPRQGWHQQGQQDRDGIELADSTGQRPPRVLQPV